MSTQPGVTTLPVASISRLKLPPIALPTSTILSPSIATSPVNGAPPVPSTMVPFRMIRSRMASLPLTCLYRRILRRRGGSAREFGETLLLRASVQERLVLVRHVRDPDIGLGP